MAIKNMFQVIEITTNRYKNRLEHIEPCDVINGKKCIYLVNKEIFFVGFFFIDIFFTSTITYKIFKNHYSSPLKAHVYLVDT